MRSKFETIRIGVIGNVDSGKSTLVGVMTKGELDDGRGYARSFVLEHPHEKETGRTSSITHECIKEGNKVIEFVDLAGHEKYFKTTVKGICSHCIDYVLLIVNGNMGSNLTMMTKEHLFLALSMKIPVIVVITKIDIAPSNILEETVLTIKDIIKRNKMFSHMIMSTNDLDKDLIKQYTSSNESMNTKLIPMIKISNKTGENINLLKQFLLSLTNTQKFEQTVNNHKFIVTKMYNVKGVGHVFSGYVYQGIIKKGDIMFLNYKNTLIKVSIKSIHDDFKTLVDELYAGESGCLAIKIINKVVLPDKIKSGFILMSKPELKYNFNATIYIATHSGTIKKGYRPMLNSMTINQVAVLEDIEDKEVIRCREMAKVKFKFINNPEFFNPNQYFVFRDGRIKGIGRIIE